MRAGTSSTPTVPVHHPSGATYDIGDYGRALDTRARDRRVRRAAREQARRREAGRTPARASGSRTTSRSRTASGGASTGRSRSHRGRFDRPDRFVLARPGPRDDVRADRGRRSGGPVERITVVKGDTDRSPAAPALTAPSRPRSAARRPGQAAGSWSSRPSQLAAEQLEADRADMVLDLAPGSSTSPARRARRWLGRLSHRLAAAGAARRAAGRDRLLAGRRRRSRSAPTSPSSRSTRDRHGDARAGDRSRRRRHDHQPDDRRRPDPRRGRRRDRAGAVRGVCVRRGRQPA